MRTITNTIGCLAVLSVFAVSQRNVYAQCPSTSSVTSFSDDSTAGPTDFQTLVDSNPSGIVLNSPNLTLEFEAGAFSTIPTPVGPVGFQVAAALDVNNDGKKDLIAGRRGGQGFDVLINTSVPGTTILTPTGLVGGSGDNCSMGLVAGDFDKDGDEDLIRMRCQNDSTDAILALDMFEHIGNTLAAAPTQVAAPAEAASWGLIQRSTTSMVATDWNNDGCIDIIFGNTATAPAPAGQISVLVNSATCDSIGPDFTQTVLVAGISMLGGPVSIGYADINNDDQLDLVASSPSATSVEAWLGDGSNGFLAATPLVGSGGAQGLWVEDFNLDGFPDVMWTVDGTKDARYLENTLASSAPVIFNNPLVNIDTGVTALDVDAGAVFDVDGDPNNTPDLVVGNGNPGFVEYVTLVNGTTAGYVDCAEVASGVLDLGPLSSTEFSTQSARIAPTESESTGSIRYFVSNSPSEPWIEAFDCSGGTRAAFCATFPTKSGRQLRWKALICRNPAGPTDPPPTVTQIDFRFDYNLAIVTFEAGAVASNGIVYAGGSQSVGDKGKFFALRGDLVGGDLWEAGAAIDGAAQGTRNLYTTEFGTNNRLDFTTPASANPLLVATLAAATAPDTLITWARGPRFGASGTPTRLGSIVNSTAAVLTPPGLPAHYTFLADTERSAVDSFVTANSSRPVLVLVAGKSGMVHAIRSDPADLPSPSNGTEAWGFIPDRVARGYDQDYLDSLSATPVGLQYYMDGSPGLADVYDGTGYITNLIVGGGEGLTAMTSLDVTNSDSTGPAPLWTGTTDFGAPLATPTVPGNSTTKAAVIRVEKAGVPEGKFMIVAASGLGSNANDGRRIVGRDINGAVQWFFDAACSITTDISAYETDDGLAFGAGIIDGFTDKIVFADFCGYVYIIDVNSAIKEPLTPPVQASSLGTIDTGLDGADTSDITAVFSTASTANALGSAKEIVGGIAVRADATTRLVLYFGTGGHEGVSPSLVNEFYAVYADDGSVRSKFTGGCGADGCEKFYGGTVVTETQVIFTATTDPPGGCNAGQTRLILADATAGDGGLGFTVDNSLLITQAITAPVFAAANAIYVTTLAGRVQSFGQTSAADPGSDPGQAGTTGDGIKGEYIAISGWRQALY